MPAAQKITTSRGRCRVCLVEWKVPTTEIVPERMRMKPIPHVAGLPFCCPACKSTKISYTLDQQLTRGGAAMLNLRAKMVKPV